MPLLEKLPPRQLLGQVGVPSALKQQPLTGFVVPSSHMIPRSSASWARQNVPIGIVSGGDGSDEVGGGDGGEGGVGPPAFPSHGARPHVSTQFCFIFLQRQNLSFFPLCSAFFHLNSQSRKTSPQSPVAAGVHPHCLQVFLHFTFGFSQLQKFLGEAAVRYFCLLASQSVQTSLQSSSAAALVMLRAERFLLFLPRAVVAATVSRSERDRRIDERMLREGGS